MNVIKSTRLLVCLLPIVLAGCATHDASQVQIEERAIDGQQRGQSTAPAVSLPSNTPSTSAAKSYPAQPSASIELPQQNQPMQQPAVEPARQDAVTAPVYQQAPAVTAVPTQSSDALLALLEQAENQHQRGQNQGALSSLERAQRIAPRDPIVYLQLSRLRLDMKDYPRAEQLARKGLSLSSGNKQMQSAFNTLLKRIKSR